MGKFQKRFSNVWKKIGQFEMKLCWDNLEKLEYVRDGIWRKLTTYGGTTYRRYYNYKEKCNTCGNPFLKIKTVNAEYCSNKCKQTGKHNSYYGKKTMLRETHPNWKSIL